MLDLRKWKPKWKRSGVMPGHVIMRPPDRGFHISYNPLRLSTLARKLGLKGVRSNIPETALVGHVLDSTGAGELRIHILKGDYRKEYTAAIKGGWHNCYWDVYLKYGGYREEDSD